MKGESWKRKNINPLSDLNVANLRSELQARGISTIGKKRVELDKELAQLQKGISNLPALLQTTPEATLESCNLSYYEVLPTEPLHDLKGHLSVIIPAAASIAKNETRAMINDIQVSILSKTTLRCSDYRKATVLVYEKLRRCAVSDPVITDLFQTAMEISHLMYTHDTRRTPRAILRLHNTTFLHANACLELFSQPNTNTNNRHILHSRFIHSIVSHAPIVFRLISLRSVNVSGGFRVVPRVPWNPPLGCT